jgi:NADH dehydrogenase
VNPDLTLPGHPEVFVVGDMMALNNLPAWRRSLCRAASTWPARSHVGCAGSDQENRFKYFDKGSMATISRFHAVASVGERVHLAGFFAWLMWLGVHVMYSSASRTVTTMLHWAVSFISAGARSGRRQ